MKMRIAIDAMGGDYAPVETVRGAVLAAREYSSDTEIILVGDRRTIESELRAAKGDIPEISISHASEVIEMNDTPTKAIKNKPDSSIAVGTRMHKDGDVDAFISMGNTGVMFATCLMTFGRIKGVSRPTIGSFMPTQDRGCTIFDIGANPNCRPVNLLHFGIMGSIYVDHIYGWKNPKVGLLNIGTEESKGNELALESFPLLSQNLPNFVGNIEGKDILSGKVDIVLCDGFVGNVLLKFAESFYDMMKSKVQLYLAEKPLAKVGAAFMAPAIKQLKKDMDYEEYGGVPLLGVNGVAIIGHGRSSSFAVKSAVRVARRMVAEQINDIIRRKIEEITTAVPMTETETG